MFAPFNDIKKEIQTKKKILKDLFWERLFDNVNYVTRCSRNCILWLFWEAESIIELISLSIVINLAQRKGTQNFIELHYNRLYALLVQDPTKYLPKWVLFALESLQNLTEYEEDRKDMCNKFVQLIPTIVCARDLFELSISICQYVH